MTATWYDYYPVLNAKLGYRVCIQPVDKPRWKFYVYI